MEPSPFLRVDYNNWKGLADHLPLGSVGIVWWENPGLEGQKTQFKGPVLHTFPH
jgi:hypothetical protein